MRNVAEKGATSEKKRVTPAIQKAVIQRKIGAMFQMFTTSSVIKNNSAQPNKTNS
jgi:hypothetical protein